VALHRCDASQESAATWLVAVQMTITARGSQIKQESSRNGHIVAIYIIDDSCVGQPGSATLLKPKSLPRPSSD